MIIYWICSWYTNLNIFFLRKELLTKTLAENSGYEILEAIILL